MAESSMTERALARLAESLKDEPSRRTFLARTRDRLRRWLRGALIGWIAFTLLLWLLFRCVGEANMLLAFLLYLPPQMWAIPYALAAPFTLLDPRRSLLLLLAGTACFFFLQLDWKTGIGRPETAGGAQLKVLTNNRGQHNRESLQPFKNAVGPDVILFQESAGEAASYSRAPAYAEFSHFRSLGEFTILSRFPIKAAEMVPLKAVLNDQGTPERPVGVRYVLDFQGKEIALYNIHLPTPRQTLVSYGRGAFLYGLIGLPGTPWAEKRRKYEAYWHRRLAQCDELNARLQADPLPLVVAGDFNAPDLGRAFQRLSAGLFDAHDRAGAGYGHTLPGRTRNPLSLFGPWMRLDYVFCSADWTPLSCVTEADRGSQHRAVAAVFEAR